MMAVKVLRQKHLLNLPPWEADSLLQLSCNKEKAYILAHPEYRLTFRQLVFFYYLLFQFKCGVPLAYLAHRKEFFGLDFYVDRRVLVPRPETELMVEEALKFINADTTSENILIDIGTGSGCVSVAIAKNTDKKINIFASDISRAALRVAKMNAKKHNVNIQFIHRSLLEPIIRHPDRAISEWRDPSTSFGMTNTKIVITANLPYLTNEQFINELSIQHEPKTALVASENGLALYRQLLEQMKQLNRPLTALLEFDPRQTEELKKMIYEILPAATTEIKTDLAGRDRLVVVKV